MYKSEKIWLTPFRPEDIEGDTYRSWFHDPEVTTWNSHGLFPQTPAALKEFAEELGSRHLVLKIFVVNKDNGKDNGWVWVGNCSLQSFNWIHRSAELAIIIGDPQAWGKGVATDACRFLLKHGFERMNLNRIWTGTAVTNIGMQHVAQKVGMKLEGISREGMFLAGGYVDVHHYGILRKEWAT